MRDDMAERFSEPKGRYKKSKFPRRQKKVARLDEDGQPPEYTSMRKVHLAVGDWYSDNGHGSDYSILRRFLVANRGRPWDEVYSEICSKADERTHDGHRLREAVDNIVCTTTELNEDGEVVSKDRWGRTFDRWFGFWHEFYVHPEKKTLEWNESRRNRYRHKKTYEQRVFEMDGQLYHQHAGIWYRVEMKLLPTVGGRGGGYWVYDPAASIVDAFGAHNPPKTNPPYTHRPWYYWDRTERLKRKYGLSPDGQAWYCFAKQSAGKREIEKLKKKINPE